MTKNAVFRRSCSYYRVENMHEGIIVNLSKHLDQDTVDVKV